MILKALLKLKNILSLTKNKIFLTFSFFLILILYIFNAINILPMNFGADEVGHISYIHQIKKEKSIPNHKEAYLIEDKIFFAYNPVTKKYKIGRESKLNWIAKHPPLYYYLNAMLIDRIDPEDQLSLITFSKLTRILSCFLFSLSFLIIYKCLIKSKINPSNSILYSLAIFTTPLLIVSASTTSNDALVFFFSVCTFYFFNNYILTNKNKDLFFLGLIVSLAILTKMLSLILLAVLISVFLIILLKKKIKINQFIIFLFASLFLVSIYFYYKNYLLGDDTNIVRFPKKDKFGEVNIFFQYIGFIFDQNIIGSQLRHLYFMGGWGGGGRSMFVTDFKLLFFLVTLLFGLSICLINISSKLYLKLEETKSVFKILFFIPFFIFFIHLNITYITFDYLLSSIILSSLLIISIFCFFLIILGETERVEYYGFIIFTLFLLILDIKLLEQFIYKEKYSGLHGRYLYPVLPFLFMSIIQTINNTQFSNLFLFKVIYKNLKISLVISIILIMNSFIVFLIDIPDFIITTFNKI